MGLDMQFEIIAQAYSNSLAEHPFITKGMTGFFLCGMGDILAQIRGFQYETNSASSGAADFAGIPSVEKINKSRLARFAAKGFFGTSIWAKWYDLSDSLFTPSNVMAALAYIGLPGFLDVDGSNAIVTMNVARVLGLMFTEQFIACPIIYGCWEIPASTVVNGAPVSRVPFEVKDKLPSMLIENAKLWTFLNVIIYNCPVQFRSILANLGDIVWQSIVSEFAAKCGNSIKDDKALLEEYVKVEQNLEVDGTLVGAQKVSFVTNTEVSLGFITNSTKF